MRRRDRPRTWGLWGSFQHVVTRDLSIEVDERTLADGTVLKLLDTAEVTAAAEHLIALGCEAVGIVFINAHANNSNELEVLEAVRAVWPNEHVNASSLILPEIRAVGLGSAIVPRYPGVTSALGCVIADMRRDFVHTINRRSTSSTSARSTRRWWPPPRADSSCSIDPASSSRAAR